MTPTQKLISLFIVTLILLGIFQLYQLGFFNPQATVEEGQPGMFSGIQHVSKSDITTLFPESKSQPVLIEFKSKFCLDCKRMEPVLSAFQQSFGQKVQFHVFDVTLDRKANSVVFQDFQPSTVPIVIFVAQGGSIQSVLYGYHTKEELATVLKKMILHI